MKEILADFEKANPGITVKFNNTGTARRPPPRSPTPSPQATAPLTS